MKSLCPINPLDSMKWWDLLKPLGPMRLLNPIKLSGPMKTPGPNMPLGLISLLGPMSWLKPMSRFNQTTPFRLKSCQGAIAMNSSKSMSSFVPICTMDLTSSLSLLWQLDWIKPLTPNTPMGSIGPSTPLGPRTTLGPKGHRDKWSQGCNKANGPNDVIESEGAISLYKAIGCNETNDPMSHWFQWNYQVQ